MKQNLVLITIGCFLFAVLLAGGKKDTLFDFTEPPEDSFTEPLQDVEWGPGTDVRTFFPGQGSLQWMANVDGHDNPVAGEGSMDEHPSFAADNVVAGEGSCQGCHGSDLNEGEFAADLVDEEKGIEGKDPYKDIDIEAAFDSEYLYIRSSWETQNDRPGITHGTFQYVDGDWDRPTVSKNSAKHTVEDLEEGEYYSYEDRIAVMLAPKDVGEEIKAFGNEGMSLNQAGCWVSCHSGMRQMPERPDASEVQDDPWLGSDNLDRTDIRKYLLETRDVEEFAEANAEGNWRTDGLGYDASDQQAGFENQNFKDLWQFRANRSASMYGASNDAVMDYRHSGLADQNQGNNYWFTQDPAGEQPDDWDELEYDEGNHVWVDAQGDEVNVADYIWMYDADEAGFEANALPADAIDEEEGQFELTYTLDYPLLTQGPDRNAEPLDMEAIDEGDRIPRRVLREGTGIRGELSTFSSWDDANNEWTVTFRKPLNENLCDHGDYGDWCSDLEVTSDDLAEDGQGVTINFAIFDDHSSNRYHHVSFPFTIQDHEDADIIAQDNREDVSLNQDTEKPSFGLSNYPNPAEDQTTITFELEETRFIELNVYDLQGKHLMEITKENFGPGKHEVEVDLTELETGMYHYNLKSEFFSESDQLIIN